MKTQRTTKLISAAICLVTVAAVCVTFFACAKKGGKADTTETGGGNDMTETVNDTGTETEKDGTETVTDKETTGTVSGETTSAGTTAGETTAAGTTASTTKAETSKPAEPKAPETHKVTVQVNGGSATVGQNGAAISLSASDGTLAINSFRTKEGDGCLKSGSEYALPKSYAKGSSTADFNWKFVSAEPYSGTEKGGKTQGVRFTYKDGSTTLTVVCRCYVNGDGTFEFSSVLKNESGKDTLTVTPKSFASFRFEGVNDNYLYLFAKDSGAAEGFTQSNGVKTDGCGTYCYRIGDKLTYTVWTCVNQDWNTNGDLPLVYLLSGDCGTYVGLEWTMGKLAVTGEGKNYSVSVDMDEIPPYFGEFKTRIPAGTELVLPNVYLGGFKGDVEVGSNKFKKWFRAVKSPENMRTDINEPYTQMDMQSGLETHGVEAIKMDYGWWDSGVRGSCGNWNAYEGSWKVRNRDILGVMSGYGCKTLKSFADLAEKRGVSLTMYVLLHDTVTSPGKPTAAEGEFNSITHPDWFSNRLIDNGMGASADLGNTECVGYLKKAMKDFFVSNNVTTWRSDFEPISRASDRDNRHFANGTDVQYWCTVGFGELCDYLMKNVDGFRYESCSSGGSLKDLYTATLASVINVEDTANYLSARMAFYDASYVIPPSQLQLPCNVDNATFGNPYYYPKITRDGMTNTAFKKAMIDMEYRTQILGAPMFSSWSGTVMGDQLEKYTDMYKNKVRPLIREGDLYHILPRPDGVNWDGVMYVNADTANELKGCVFLFKPSKNAGESVTVKLRGLEANTTYVLTFEDRPEQNVTAKGSVLMNKGVTLKIPETIGSDIIWITEK